MPLRYIHLMMRISDRMVGDVTVIEVAGRVEADDNIALRDRIAALLGDEKRQIVLDLGDLTYLDSAALGELVACQLRAGRVGGTLKLANAGRRLKDLLLLTRLITVFDAHDSVDGALASFDK